MGAAFGSCYVLLGLQSVLKIRKLHIKSRFWLLLIKTNKQKNQDDLVSVPTASCDSNQLEQRGQPARRGWEATSLVDAPTQTSDCRAHILSFIFKTFSTMTLETSRVGSVLSEAVDVLRAAIHSRPFGGFT